MKMHTITNANAKGQIVIPAAMRQQLEIDSEAPLLLTLKGTVITIEKVLGVETMPQRFVSYLDVLRKTRGSWHADNDSTNDARQEVKQRETELTAAKKRASAW